MTIRRTLIVCAFAAVLLTAQSVVHYQAGQPMDFSGASAVKVPTVAGGTNTTDAASTAQVQAAIPLVAFLKANNLSEGNAAAMRTSLGLGSAATQSAASFGLVANPLSQFASTTSAGLRATISDESGSGPAIFGGSALFQAPVLRGTSGTISGALTIGTCNTATVTVMGATTGMVVEVSPVSNPDAGSAGLTRWDGYVSSANTVTVRECGLGVVTPNATAYNVAVIP